MESQVEAIAQLLAECDSLQEQAAKLVPEAKPAHEENHSDIVTPLLDAQAMLHLFNKATALPRA